METRKEMYTAIQSKLKDAVEEVKHIDLWNHNVELIEQEKSWARPAVFVEFGPIAWQPYTGGGYRGEGILRLHVVTNWAEGGQEAAWALTAKIREAMKNIKGESFYDLRLKETLTNHKHKDILESIEGYMVKSIL